MQHTIDRRQPIHRKSLLPIVSVRSRAPHPPISPWRFPCPSFPPGHQAHGAELEAEDNFQRTAVHLAAMSGSVAGIDVLSGVGANINSVDILGRTPLHLAVSPPSPIALQ